MDTALPKKFPLFFPFITSCDKVVVGNKQYSSNFHLIKDEVHEMKYTRRSTRDEKKNI